MNVSIHLAGPTHRDPRVFGSEASPRCDRCFRCLGVRRPSSGSFGLTLPLTGHFASDRWRCMMASVSERPSRVPPKQGAPERRIGATDGTWESPQGACGRAECVLGHEIPR